MEPRRRKPDDDAAPVAKMRRWGPVDILSAPENRATVAKLGRFMFAVAVCPPQGRKRVIQRRFNVSVPRARVPKKASMLRDRSER